MAAAQKASYRKLRKIKDEVLADKDVTSRAEIFKRNFKMSIPEWIEKWEGTPFAEKSERWK